jgi:hypothetical protein
MASEPPKPTLGGMPLNVLAKIFDKMSPDDKTMLALVNKKFLGASLETNNGRGVFYKRPLLNNEPLLAVMTKWMGPGRRFCAECDKFLPADSSYWENRYRKGRAKVASLIYGNRKNSFDFNQIQCPECFADCACKRAQKAHFALRDISYS